MGSARKSLKDVFSNEPPRAYPGPRCNVGIILGIMDKDDAEALNRAMADHAWTTRNIVSVLVDNGYVISSHSVMRHRRGDCACPR